MSKDRGIETDHLQISSENRRSAQIVGMVGIPLIDKIVPPVGKYVKIVESLTISLRFVENQNKLANLDLE